ncbi:hypothetical protein ACW0JT_22365 [Arthrobacter sp. SA17]
MTMTPQRTDTSAPALVLAPTDPRQGAPRRAGPYPWAMAAAVALAVSGAALSLNGVLRGWAWYMPVVTTVVVVVVAMALLRTVRAQPLLVAAGGFLSLVLILTFTFSAGTASPESFHPAKRWRCWGCTCAGPRKQSSPKVRPSPPMLASSW